MNQKTEEESASFQISLKEVTASSKATSKIGAKTSSTEMPASASNTRMKMRSNKRPNGRLGKRKTRKTVRIKNLDAIDFLHNETLLSTAPKGDGKKSPPPPGCVDYEFTSLTALAADTVPIHTELPPATYETPYGLQVLLDLYREQFLAMIRCMKSDDFRKNVEIQIIDEKEKKRKLTAKLEQLEKQINLLIGDSLKLLRTRMSELGVANGYNAKDLMAKAKEIMSQHQELRGEAFQLNHEIPVLQEENHQLLSNNEENADVELPNVQVTLNAANLDNYDSSLSNVEIPIEQLKSEPMEISDIEDNDDVPSPASPVRMDVVPKVEPHSLKSDPVEFNVTPCSIVLPRIMDGAKLKLLTPAQKKFAYMESQINTPIRDSPAVNVSSNNENKPPSEKHSSSRKHRHKKSHKSKRKHKHHIAPEQRDTSLLKPTQTEHIDPPYARTTTNRITDSIEDIITQTLNDNSGSVYPSQSSSSAISPVMNYWNGDVPNGDCYERTDPSDYRRVPPMKIALKKFAQENKQTNLPANFLRTTVGDLVSSEIEKSLEISNRNTVNQLSVPFDYDALNRSTLKPSSVERKERYEQLNTKSPFLTPTYVMPSPSQSSSLNSPKFKEEPLEGLAASMFNVVNSNRLSEAGSSRHSSPYCTPPMNLEFKMNEPSSVPQYLCSNSSSCSAPRLPNEASFSADQRSHADGNKWQEVSLCFDRMFEYVSNKIDSHENVPNNDKFKSRAKDSTAADKHSPTFALNPPPLFRADSSFLDSPPMPDLPVSPASLEGPFSPVPSLSPPALSSPLSSSAEGKDESSNYNEKFRPKGKGWKWS